jgi:anti-sigma factor RsiW
MAQLIRLTSEIRADLVAYLDGELDEQATERIEAVLAQSNVARNDVEALAQTYELLDVLPRYEAPAEFTAQTLASIRVSELRPDFRQSTWFRRARGNLIALAWMAALATVIALSFLATRRWVQTEADVLIRELPVIEQLDVYSEVGSVEFLQLLDRQTDLLQEMSPLSPDAEAAHD